MDGPGQGCLTDERQSGGRSQQRNTKYLVPYFTPDWPGSMKVE